MLAVTALYRLIKFAGARRVLFLVDRSNLGEQAALTDGPFGSHLKTSHYTTDGPRVIRLQNVGEGVFHDERAHISHSHFEKLRKHEARRRRRSGGDAG